MEIAELFMKKIQDKDGNELEEEWVAIKKTNGRVVKLMSLEAYLKTCAHHPASI